MIGVARTAPNCPGLVIVKVPPWTSSGWRPAIPRPLRDVGDRRRHALEAQPLGLTDHRHHEAVVQGDRDAEVDVLVVDDLVLADRGVQPRVSLQRLDRRQRDERQIGEVDAAPAHRVALRRPPGGDPGEVRLHDRRAVSCRAPAVRHVAGDGLAHGGHRLGAALGRTARRPSEAARRPMQLGLPRPRPRSAAARPPPPVDRGTRCEGRAPGPRPERLREPRCMRERPSSVRDRRSPCRSPGRGRRRACPRSAGPRASRRWSDRRPPPPPRPRRARAAHLPAAACRCARRGAPRRDAPRR